jgi:hypothetical protein
VYPVSQWHVPIFLAVLAQCSAFVMEEYLIEGKRSKAHKRFIKELGRRDVALDDSANEPHVRLNARDIHARAWHRLAVKLLAEKAAEAVHARKRMRGCKLYRGLRSRCKLHRDLVWDLCRLPAFAATQPRL